MFTLRGNQQLIFRSYIIIVVGVLVLGFLLDWVLLNKLDDGVDEAHLADQAFVSASYALIEQHLATRDQPEWERELQRLQDLLAPSLGMQLSHIDDIAAVNNEIALQLQSKSVVHFYDANQQAHFYKVLLDGNTVLSLWPLEKRKNAATLADRQWKDKLRSLVPLVFYASIFVLVWVWIRPLLRDLDSLNTTAQALQRDHRETVPDFNQVSTIRPLADSFRSMTMRLRGLIEGQKEFTNALSHELRTPLARIKFGLAIIEKDLHRDAKPELENLRKDVQEIDALIDAMLEYARLEHPDTELQWQSVPAQQLISSTVSKFRTSDCVSDAAVTVDVNSDIGRLAVACDPYLIALSLSNLLSNALRYASATVVVSFNCDGGLWQLVVEDDGPGIPPENREDVLKAFSRLDTSRGRGTGGYGLGLAIVTRIASLHGGAVFIRESSLGGASFNLQWPVKENIAEANDTLLTTATQ